jgi:NTE family protein
MLSFTKFIPPRKIVLSGGGIRAIAHVGALEVLEEKNLLRSVTEFVGVSAGAFVAFTMVLGYTLKEIRLLCSLYDFSRIRNLEPEAAFAFPTTFGLDDGSNLVKLLETLMRHKNISIDMTFGQWQQTYPTAAHLRCFATDLFETRPREFSATQTPNIRLVDALRATMSLPGYFIPVSDVESGHMLTDGGILHNFPLGFLTSEERAVSLGISFSYDHTQVSSISDISTFLSQVFACYYLPRVNAVHTKNRERCIIIPCGHVPAWNFEATSEERLELIEAGREAARAFFDSYSGHLANRKPVRRYSVS